MGIRAGTVVLVLAAALLPVACSDDDSLASPPATTTTAGAVTTTEPAPSSTTSTAAPTTTSIAPERTIEVTFERWRDPDGEIEPLTIAWTGTVDTLAGGTRRFAGLATPVDFTPEQVDSTEPFEFDIRLRPDGTPISRTVFAWASPEVVHGMLPVIDDDALAAGVGTELPTGGLYLEIGIGSYTMPLRWRIEAVDGREVTIEASGETEEEFNTRGAYNHMVG